MVSPEIVTLQFKPFTKTFEPIYTSSFKLLFPLTLKSPLNTEFPLVSNAPPTCKFFFIIVEPAIFTVLNGFVALNDPLNDTSVICVRPVTVVLPITYNEPLTFVLFFTSMFPSIVVFPVVFVVPVTFNSPVIVVFFNVVFPLTSSVFLTLVVFNFESPVISKPPITSTPPTI